MNRLQTQKPNRDHYRKESNMPTWFQRILGLAPILSLLMSVQAAEPPAPMIVQPPDASKTSSSALPRTATEQKVAWTISTADTKVTVGVDSMDRLAIYELVNPDLKWNWTAQPSVIPLPTRMEVRTTEEKKAVGFGPTVLHMETQEKKDLPNPATWTFLKGITSSSSNGTTVTLTFACTPEPALSLESVWWAGSPDLPGPVQHTFRLVNQSTNDVFLHPIPNFSFAVQPSVAHDVTVWRFGDVQSKTTQKHRIGSLTADVGGKDKGTEKVQMRFEGSGGKLGQWMPFVLLDDRDTRGLYLGMEEKGSYEFQVTTHPATPQFGLKAAYKEKYNLRIKARQTITTRSIYLGLYQGDVDDGCNRFKRWFWNNKTPANHRNDPTTPWATFGGMWSYNNNSKKGVWWSDEATYRKGVEKEGLAKMGFEAVEVDAFWDKADKVGDWPSGTKIMGPLAHANGLKFTLYLMNYISWGSREKLPAYWNDYQIDMWRNDFQVAGLDVQQWAQENCPRNYRFQFCAASPDFHTMTYAALNDVYDDNPDVTRQAFYTQSYTLPPGQLSILVHLPYMVWDKGSPKWSWSKDRFVRYLRSTMLAGSWIAVAAIGPGYNLPDIVVPSDLPEMIPLFESNLSLYKSKIRPLIREGNLYHNIVEAKSGFDGVEYNCSTQDCAVVMLFGPAGKSVTVKCKRLQPEQKYQVRFTDLPAQNTTLTGSQLMSEGLPVAFTGTTRSEIILIEKSR